MGEDANSYIALAQVASNLAQSQRGKTPQGLSPLLTGAQGQQAPGGGPIFPQLGGQSGTAGQAQVAPASSSGIVEDPSKSYTLEQLINKILMAKQLGMQNTPLSAGSSSAGGGMNYGALSSMVG